MISAAEKERMRAIAETRAAARTGHDGMCPCAPCYTAYVEEMHRLRLAPAKKIAPS